MLGQRLWRWPSIKPALVVYLVSATRMISGRLCRKQAPWSFFTEFHLLFKKVTRIKAEVEMKMPKRHVKSNDVL